MSDKSVDWLEEVVIDSPVKVKMHYFGTEAEKAEEEEIDDSPVRHGFTVADKGYLIAPGCYAELINRVPICTIPDTPSCFIGFINHRGDTVPVFHLPRLQTPDAQVIGRWILLLDQGSRCMGLLLEKAPERLREDWLKEPEEVDLPEALQPCLGETYRRGLQQWTEFDHRTFCDLVRQQFGAN